MNVACLIFIALFASGVTWTIEKRYHEFRALRREVSRVAYVLAELPFPKKSWFFNLSSTVLRHRQEVLREYLTAAASYHPEQSTSPHLPEISEFQLTDMFLFVA